MKVHYFPIFHMTEQNNILGELKKKKKLSYRTMPRSNMKEKNTYSTVGLNTKHCLGRNNCSTKWISVVNLDFFVMYKMLQKVQTQHEAVELVHMLGNWLLKVRWKCSFVLLRLDWDGPNSLGWGPKHSTLCQLPLRSSPVEAMVPSCLYQWHILNLPK